MAGKDGRKCVFISEVLHGQLAAILSLRGAGGERGLSLQGFIDRIVAEWLKEHPVREFLIEHDAEAD